MHIHQSGQHRLRLQVNDFIISPCGSVALFNIADLISLNNNTHFLLRGIADAINQGAAPDHSSLRDNGCDKE
jgi:hypothetical protein